MATRLLTTQRIVNLSSDPASANAGEIYYNTSLSKLKFYDGSAWSEIGSGSSGGGAVEVSDTAPSTPSSGLLWYNSTNGKTYVYYEDGTSNQWVEIGAATFDVTANYDGGTPTSIYGGIADIDGGGV